MKDSRFLVALEMTVLMQKYPADGSSKSFPIPLLGGARGGLIFAAGIGTSSHSPYTFSVVITDFPP
jgi:hypothetical protein